MNDKTEKIARAMELIASSLTSHLGYTYGTIPAAMKKRGESIRFHKKCVKEYAECLSILSELL